MPRIGSAGSVARTNRTIPRNGTTGTPVSRSGAQSPTAADSQSAVRIFRIYDHYDGINATLGYVQLSATVADEMQRRLKDLPFGAEAVEATTLTSVNAIIGWSSSAAVNRDDNLDDSLPIHEPLDLHAIGEESADEEMEDVEESAQPLPPQPLPSSPPPTYVTTPNVYTGWRSDPITGRNPFARSPLFVQCADDYLDEQDDD